jgi:hypothetical protein
MNHAGLHNWYGFSTTKALTMRCRSPALQRCGNVSALLQQWPSYAACLSLPEHAALEMFAYIT